MWRQKARFDEGSGVVDARAEVLGAPIGGEVMRTAEGALYLRLLRERFADPARIEAAAGSREEGRAVAG